MSVTQHGPYSKCDWMRCINPRDGRCGKRNRKAAVLKHLQSSDIGLEGIRSAVSGGPRDEYEMRLISCSFSFYDILPNPFSMFGNGSCQFLVFSCAKIKTRTEIGCSMAGPCGVIHTNSRESEESSHRIPVTFISLTREEEEL